MLEELTYEELSKHTKKEIIDRLDVLEVDYTKSMTKDELIDLLRAEGGQFDDPVDVKKYAVLADFKDLKDKSYVYFKGDTYPREGNKNVTQERIDELSSANNKIGKQLIKEQE